MTQLLEVLNNQKLLSFSHSSLYINRHELDLASERLSVELKKLDHHVSTAVIDHITTVFADAELPVHNMIQAATASLLVRLETLKLNFN